MNTTTVTKHVGPMKAVRIHCLYCCLEQAVEVRECGATECPSCRFRLNKKPAGISSLKTIRAQCMDCCGNNDAEVRRCEETDCSLYCYRMGHNPSLTGKG